ncbi:MAG TPA: S1 RNA-binding domain-containing protein [Candidatus Polarisedimenticolaceae bacterium]|nr:S1 RNA-binding domain-containing protein [Candidatus Polarisedimenticolaceae bacterium]
MTEPDDEFARLLAESLQAKPFEQGQTVSGRIIAIWPDVAFVDVGGKGEATIDLDDLKDAEGDLEVEVGDRIDAVVVATAGGLKLSRKLARGAASARQVEDAYRAGIPVEGKVERAIKGGFEVRIAGQRAFCPISQIGLRGADATGHEGRVYSFRIVEWKEGGKNLVVSRRALLEEEEREKAAEVRKEIVPGAVLPGRVASVREYGAFIELGAGIQGLLHVSEMGWSRVTDPGSILKPGDEIAVKVLRVEAEGGKIALGLKQLQDDPWAAAAVTYAPGQVHAGRVTRLAEFGAFVELAPGIEGLAHVSTFPPTGTAEGWKTEVPVGLVGDFEILTVEPDKKRIGVALVRSAAQALPKSEIAPGARVRGKVDRIERYGVFVYLAPGKTGLIPIAETGVAKEADLPKAFPAGADVEVEILEVDPGGRRIRLSRKAVIDREERDEVRGYAAREDHAPKEAFGSLADKLRGALKTPKNS